MEMSKYLVSWPRCRPGSTFTPERRGRPCPRWRPALSAWSTFAAAILCTSRGSPPWFRRPQSVCPCEKYPLTPSLLQVCEQLMTMHLAGRRSAAGKPSPGKTHPLRQSQLAAGVPDAMVSHTKGHADVSPVNFYSFPILSHSILFSFILCQNLVHSIPIFEPNLLLKRRIFNIIYTIVD